MKEEMRRKRSRSAQRRRRLTPMRRRRIRRRRRRGKKGGMQKVKRRKGIKEICRNLTVPAALELSASGRKLNQWDEGGKVLCPLVKSPVLVMQLRCEIILNINNAFGNTRLF